MKMGSPAVAWMSGDRGVGYPGGVHCSRIIVGGSPTPINCDRLRSCLSRVLRVAVWALQCRFEHVDQILVVPCGSRGPPPVGVLDDEGVMVLQEDHHSEEIIARVAALDIGKAELMCCIRILA